MKTLCLVLSSIVAVLLALVLLVNTYVDCISVSDDSAIKRIKVLSVDSALVSYYGDTLPGFSMVDRFRYKYLHPRTKIVERLWIGHVGDSVIIDAISELRHLRELNVSLLEISDSNISKLASIGTLRELRVRSAYLTVINEGVPEARILGSHEAVRLLSDIEIKNPSCHVTFR